MRSTHKLATTALAAFTVALAAGSAAGAEDQIVTGTVASSVSISAAPADVDLGALPVTAASIGSISVQANDAYTLTAKAEKATMTLWDSTAGTYDASGVALSEAMLLTSTASSGLGTGIPATALGTADLIIGTGATGLITSTTDVYDLAATQTVLGADVAGLYRNKITYTVTAGV